LALAGAERSREYCVPRRNHADHAALNLRKLPDKPEEMNVALDEVQIGGREIGPGRRMLKRIGLLFVIGALGMVDPRRLDQQALVGGLQRSLLCRTSGGDVRFELTREDSILGMDGAIDVILCGTK
jgi:hypothetical protein